MKKNNSQLIKQLNDVKILNILREDSPISRISLAQKAHISKVAISDIINRLGKEDFILEIGKGKSTEKGGKRPTLVKLNPDKGYVVGIEFKREKALIAIANIESVIASETEAHFKIDESINTVIQDICTHIDEQLDKLKISKDKLISIGIGVPGFINYEKGELIFADTMKGWDKQPFAAQFSKHYHIPVLIENDVNLITTGEHLLGAGKNQDNLVCIWIGGGIGAGIITDGQLLRGISGSAGEIGYFELSNDLPNRSFLKNLYANQRYYGDILSENHLYDTIKIKLQWDKDSLEKGIENYSLAELLKLGDTNNTTIQEILDEYAILISDVCVKLIKTLNMGMIILSGTVVENSNYLFQKIQQFIKGNMHNIPFKVNSIKVGELGDQACVRGALTMALRVVFEPLFVQRNLNQIHIKE